MGNCDSPALISRFSSSVTHIASAIPQMFHSGDDERKMESASGSIHDSDADTDTEQGLFILPTYEHCARDTVMARQCAEVRTLREKVNQQNRAYWIQGQQLNDANEAYMIQGLHLKDANKREAQLRILRNVLRGRVFSLLQSCHPSKTAPEACSAASLSVSNDAASHHSERRGAAARSTDTLLLCAEYSS